MSRSHFFFLASSIALSVLFVQSYSGNETERPFASGRALVAGARLAQAGDTTTMGDVTSASLQVGPRNPVTAPTPVVTAPLQGGNPERDVQVKRDAPQPPSGTKTVSSTPPPGNLSVGNSAFTPTGLTLPDFLRRITSIFDGIIPFIIGLTVFFIIWKIVVYIIHAGEEEKRTEAKHFVLWGIIGIFFMLSIWGFVNVLVNSFELDTVIDPGDIPTVPLIEAPTP